MGETREASLALEIEPASSVSASLSRQIARALAFYFKNPIKLFKPTVIESLHVLKLQASNKFEIVPNSLQTIYYSLKYDGIRKFSVNVLPSFGVNVFLGSMMFATFETSNEILHHTYSPKAPSPSLIFASGALAGTCQAILSCPVDATNVQMWQRKRAQYGGSLLHEMFGIWKNQGFKTFYRELPITLVRDGLGLALFFTTFEVVKTQLKTDKPIIPLQNGLAVIAAGALAGLAHQFVHHPLELLKRSFMLELQKQKIPKPTLLQRYHVLNNLIIRRHGIGYIFRGWNQSMKKAMPPAAIAFLMYEYMTDGINLPVD